MAGTYDYVAAPVTVTKERADNMLFTEGYLNTDFQFLIKKGAPKVTELKQLKGKMVSVNKGSAYDSWARGLEGKIGWTVESFGTQTDAVQAVLAGRAYANVAGNTAIEWAVKQQPQLQLSYLYSTGLVWAAAFRKDFKELLAQVENAIECMKHDGTIAAMHERWFGIKPAAGSAAVTMFPGTACPAWRATSRAAPSASAADLTSGRCPTRMAILTIAALRKSFGATEVLKGIDLSVRRARARLRHRPVGLGQEHAAALHQSAGGADLGSVVFDGVDVKSRAADINALRRASAWCSSPSISIRT